MIQALAKKHMPALAELRGRLIWEKRSEPRYPSHDLASVQILPKNGSSALATILDVSRNGLRIQLPGPVPVHSHVEIAFHEGPVVVLGEVRHCSRIGSEYYAGVLILKVGLRNHLGQAGALAAL